MVDNLNSWGTWAPWMTMYAARVWGMRAFLGSISQLMAGLGREGEQDGAWLGRGGFQPDHTSR